MGARKPQVLIRRRGEWMWACTDCTTSWFGYAATQPSALATALAHIREVHTPAERALLWEDDGTACTPCRGCPGCHAVKPAQRPANGVDVPVEVSGLKSPLARHASANRGGPAPTDQHRNEEPALEAAERQLDPAAVITDGGVA